MGMSNVMTMKMKFKKNQKGLTLIELLAVIVILGIIAAIAVPAIGGIINNTEIGADESTDTMVIEAVVLKLLAENAPTATAATGTVASLATDGYLSKTATWNDSANVKLNYSATFTDGVWEVTLSTT